MHKWGQSRSRTNIILTLTINVKDGKNIYIQAMAAEKHLCKCHVFEWLFLTMAKMNRYCQGTTPIRTPPKVKTLFHLLDSVNHLTKHGEKKPFYKLHYTHRLTNVKKNIHSFPPFPCHEIDKMWTLCWAYILAAMTTICQLVKSRSSLELLDPNKPITVYKFLEKKLGVLSRYLI